MMPKRFYHSLVVVICLLVLTSCATTPPRNPGNACSIFDEKRGWFDAAKDAEKRWGTPVHVTMSIMYWESRFVDDARPARKKLFGIIPLWRPSSAYGYPQAKDETWDWYQDKSGNSWSSRDNFDDAIDFIAWYCYQSHKKLGISKWDAYSQYLAYHEGQGGYARGTYKSKGWLMKRARQVEDQAKRYRTQLSSCEADLDDGWF